MALRFSSNQRPVSKLKTYFFVTHDLAGWWVAFDGKCEGPYGTKEEAIADGEKKGRVLL